MLSFAKKNRLVKAIIFDSVDRMTRNMKDYDQIQRLIREYGIEVHFARSGNAMKPDSAPTNTFVTGIEALTSNHYSNLISSKVKSAMVQKASEGIYPSIAPLGYINDLVQRKLAVDPVRSPYITKAFELYASGSHSLRSLHLWLIEQGFRNKKGGKIVHSAIEKILKNPIYHGYFVWNGITYKGIHTPIITKELFDKVQNRMHRKGYAVVATKREFPFRSIFTCGRCGCRFTTATYKKKYDYCHCSFTNGKCGNPYILQEKIAELFGEQVVKKVFVENGKLDWLKEALKRKHASAKTNKTEQVTYLKAELNRIDKRIDALYNDKLDGKIPETSGNKNTQNLVKTKLILKLH